jgi:hypothetical protein
MKDSKMNKNNSDIHTDSTDEPTPEHSRTQSKHFQIAKKSKESTKKKDRIFG